MGIEDIANEIAREWNVIRSVPLLFVAAVAVASFAVWKVIVWRYVRTIEALEHRLQLKDDTIAHMERRLSAEAKRTENLRATAKTDHRESHWPLSAEIIREDEEERDFVSDDVTVLSLSAIYRGRTHLQGDRLASPYIGKWIRVSGVVQIVTSLMQDSISVSMSQEEIDYISHGTWMQFDGDEDRLLALRPGDRITVAGKITAFDEHELKLSSCELIKAG